MAAFTKDALVLERQKLSIGWPLSNRVWINNYSEEPTEGLALQWRHHSEIPWYTGRIKWVLRPGTIMRIFVCFV